VRLSRSRSFRNIKKGQMVTRLVAGEAAQLRVTSVERGLIHCGELTFERDLGLEVDPVLGPGVWGVVRSQLQYEPRPTGRRSAPVSAAGIHLLQGALLPAYVTTLTGMAVATALGRYPLAVELGAGVALIGVTMHVSSHERRALVRARMNVRSGDKAWGSRRRSSDRLGTLQ
jgi:hypothetical protein